MNAHDKKRRANQKFSFFGALLFYQTRSYLKRSLLCTFVLHVCASFWSSFLFLKPNFFLLLHDGEFDLIRRAHLLCILKRHHTYGVNTFVCSYSLNPKPSIPFYSLRFSIGNPTCFAGFRVSWLFSRDAFALRANVSNLEQYFTKPWPRWDLEFRVIFWVPSRTKQIRRGSEALCLRTFSSSSFSTSSSSSSSHIIHPWCECVFGIKGSTEIVFVHVSLPLVFIFSRVRCRESLAG